jgi:hypothetical protein
VWRRGINVARKPRRQSVDGNPGIPVDSQGGPTIDPTKNVLDLVLAAVTRLDDLMDAATSRIDDLATRETARQDELRNALDSRLTALNAQRDTYEERIQHIRRDYEKQNEEVKSDFGKQIAAILQAQADKNALLLSSGVDKLGASTSDRLALVEKNQYVTGGASAARDPALDRKLDEIQSVMSKLQSGGNKQEGSSQGQSQLIIWIFAAITAASVLYNMLSPHVATIPGH